MEQPSDGQLLAAYGRGDAQAYAALLARHEAALLRHAHALLCDRANAEDAVQEAFLKLLERPPALPREVLGNPAAEHAQLAAWLHKVTRNACMDLMRSETRRKRREEERAMPESTGGAVGGGVDGVDHADTRAAVELGLARLTPDQREVLALRLFGERSYDEIARITGKKIGTVGWLVSTGLRALSRELEPVLGMDVGIESGRNESGRGDGGTNDSGANLGRVRDSARESQAGQRGPEVREQVS